MKELLELGADPNYLTVYAGWRPLHYAAWADHPVSSSSSFMTLEPRVERLKGL